MFDKIEKDLLKFQKPGRYIGNEYGIPKKNFRNSLIRFVICYPDVYEIGMSNLGIKIIYDIINKIDYASCERVFAPWDDFEKYLRENNYPLFSLETKTPLDNFDILGFSLQYELLFTNFLNIISLSGVPVFSKDRKENDPIILCGGPVVTNPAPFSPFSDLFFIGEAEDVLIEFLDVLKIFKTNKKTRLEKIEVLSNIEGFYSPIYSKNKVKRRIYSGFSDDLGITTHIIPNIDIIQNKLVVEIMRGCPNKCRFCQAGIIYKPYREKNISTIIKTIDYGVKSLGTNEVTLSSLSSGDYSKIEKLSEIFNNRYSIKNISFSLPSLRVESFDKELLKKMSSVRKSGLTFAIEAGSMNGQLSINKPIDIDKIFNIIQYAIDNGWKLIKFYFMIGLPFIENEENDIISFIDNIRFKFRKIDINVNLAIFIPKPHTPYQNCKQLNIEQSIIKYEIIENYYKKTKVKIKKHNPYMSYIEGFLSRGDENVGLAMYEVFKNGVRFDGWYDKFDINNYLEIFEKNGITYEKYLTGNNNFWGNIDVGINDDFIFEEIKKAENREISQNCKTSCDQNCHICANDIKTVDAQNEDIDENPIFFPKINKSENRYQYLIEYSKLDLLKYIGHIDLIRYFEKLFDRADIKLVYTQGFNPHTKLKFSQALSLGIESKCELLEIWTSYNYNNEELLKKIEFHQHNLIPINRIKKIDSKLSLNNEVGCIEYLIFFDEINKNKIEKIVDNILNKNLTYQIIKNKDNTTGMYKDYLIHIEIFNQYFLVIEKMIEHKPKFIYTMNELFSTYINKIIKNKMYSKDYHNFIDLFDFIN